MSMPPVLWQTPRPLWTRFGTGAEDQARPVILRFAGDDFMDQLMATVARDPSRLDGLIARPETWRTPASEPASLVEQTPLPTVARSAARRALARVTKGSVAASSFQDTLRENGRDRVQELKLYQPAHARFYLVGASLSCAVPGLPERPVVPGGSEELNFVLRRLLPDPTGSTDPEDLREFAFIKDGSGARWQRVDAGTAEDHYIAGEERLPVFPVSYEDDGACTRTLWTGMVPVGRREEYLAAAVVRSPGNSLRAGQIEAVKTPAAVTPQPSKQARFIQFQMEVAEPWKNLIRSSQKLVDSLTRTSSMSDDAGSESSGDKDWRVFDHNLQQQNTSWLILLDFANYLAAYLPDVWAVVQADGSGAGALEGYRATLYQLLDTATMTTALSNALKVPVANTQVRAPAASLRAALKAIGAEGVGDALEATKLSYTRAQTSLDDDAWPDFHFLLAGVNTSRAAAGPYQAFTTLAAASATEIEADPLADAGSGTDWAAMMDRLTALVGRALEARVESDAPPVPFAAQMRDALRANVGDAGWFRIRYVYTRRDCGVLHEPEVSAPTQRFQIASFFDPDAPARPIRIALPLDTSPAGLRKFNKNTAFVISDMLCGQIQRAKGLGFIDLVMSVLPWPLHKDLDVGSGGECRNASGNIGMICSLSIPIITICALILLMIIVSLLDFVFRWLPFFIMCFPLPKLSGKKATS